MNQTEFICLTSSIKMQKIRGRQVAMIFQEPMTSLKPRDESRWAGLQFYVHLKSAAKQARQKSSRCLEEAGLPATDRCRLVSTSSPLAGRCSEWWWRLHAEPDLLIADEPWPTLDAPPFRHKPGIAKVRFVISEASIPIYYPWYGVLLVMADRSPSWNKVK